MINKKIEMTCKKTYLALIISGESANSASSILGVNSSYDSKEDSAWIWTTEEQVNSLILNDHFHLFFETFEEKHADLNGLASRGNRVEVAVYWKSKKNSWGPLFENTILKKIEKMGAMLSVDIH